MAILSKATHSLTNNEARYEKMKKAAGPERGNPPLQSLLAPSQAQVQDLRNFARFCDKYWLLSLSFARLLLCRELAVAVASNP